MAASDGQVIARVSGGRALRALSVMVDSSSLTSEHEKQHYREQLVGKHILLQPPEELPLSYPSQGAKSVMYYFSSVDESSAFRNDVTAKGWSIAAGIHATKLNVLLEMVGLDVGIEASFETRKEKQHIDEEKLEDKVQQACITYCSYIPMRCFQIPKQKMRLCEDALASARQVKSSTNAGKFLKSYNSHVSGSTYHVGGIFFRELTIKSAEHTTLRNLVEIASKKMKLSGSLFFEVEGGVSGDSTASQESVSQLAMEEMKEEIVALGPTTVKDEAEFRRKLEEDHSSWTIIDKEADCVETLES